MSLGNAFLEIARRPIVNAQQYMKRGDIPNMLNSISVQNMASSFDNGIEKVATMTGLSSERIESIYSKKYQHVINSINTFAISHQNAVGVWNQHNSGFAGLVEGVFGGIVDGFLGTNDVGYGVSGWLGNIFRDARLKGPMTRLENDLQNYDMVIREVASMLSSDMSLRAHRIHRTRMLMIIWITVAAVASLAGWIIFKK